LKTPLLFLGSAAVRDVEVAPRRGDTMAITFVGTTGHARVAPDGRILAADGRGTTVQVLVERLPDVDMAAQAAAFAARPLGALSARDTARAVFGGDTLWVDYGRPLTRGRRIFGALVPWGAVWRTGANAATQFRTPVDLIVGGTHVPAGTYTLWSIPAAPRAEARWLLVINTQTGQWGTEYDAARDLARVPLTTAPAAPPVERFTFTIEATGDRAGMLAFTWADVRATVPFTIP
jgi:hypothetical protein